MTKTTKLALLSSVFLGALISTAYAEAVPSSASSSAATTATSTGSDTASVTAPADSATPPTLKINGFTLFNTYVVNQSNRTNGKGGAPIHFATDVSDLYFTIAGKAYSATSGPIDYMYRVNFQAFPNSSPA
ncbi:MAG: hypothetical protein K2X98_06080, partial [Alphaproteobacteria bacterium]|nr:hypothetical protein [Alphaproteobacteria bacterium]